MINQPAQAANAPACEKAGDTRQCTGTPHYVGNRLEVRRLGFAAKASII